MEYTKACLFDDNEVAICDMKTYKDEINGYFEPASTMILFGRPIEDPPCREFFEALFHTNYEDWYETGFTIKGFDSIDSLKQFFANYGCKLLTLDDIKQRLQSEGFATGDDATLSDNGWYDQLERALMKTDPNNDLIPDLHEYDYNNMPDHLKTSKQAAYIYAICGYDNDIVKQSGILSDPASVSDIIRFMRADNEHFVANLDDHMFLQPEILKVALKHTDAAWTRLEAMGPSAFTDQMIEIITMDNDGGRYFPKIKNDKSKEMIILKALLKAYCNDLHLTEDEINQLDKNATLEKITELFSISPQPDGLTIHRLPDWFADDKEFVLKTDNLYEASDRLRNDPDTAIAFCRKHPGCLWNFPVAYGDRDLFFTYIKDHLNYNYYYEINAIRQVAINHGYIADREIYLQLLRKGICQLNKFCADKEEALAAMEYDIDNYMYLSNDLKHDPDIWNILERKKTTSCWIYTVPDDMKAKTSEIMATSTNICLKYDINNIVHGKKLEWKDIPADLLTDNVVVNFIAHENNNLGTNLNTKLTNLPSFIALNDGMIKNLLAKSTNAIYLANYMLQSIAKVKPDATGWPEFRTVAQLYADCMQEMADKKAMGWH